MSMDVNNRFLIESLQMYADRVGGRLKGSGPDGACDISIHGVVFTIYVDEDVIGIETHVPHLRPLSKGCKEQLRDEMMVHVEYHQHNHATVSQYLRSDLLLDDDEFHTSIDEFALLAQGLAR